MREARDIFNAQITKLTIVTNVSLYMPSLLKMLADSDQELVISQYSNRRSKIEKLIHTGEVDFAICCPPLEPSRDLETIDLRYEPGVIIYPSGHWLENVDEVDIGDIKNETFISVSRGFGTRDVIDAYMQKENLSPKILIETTDTSSVFKYVEKGIGIAFVAYSQVLTEPRFRNNYTRIKGDIGGKVALTWKRSRYISEAGKLFIEKSKTFFDSLETLK